ncbi:MAG: flagellar hook-basal body complex protein, partial [Lachnospiraceae bacterium]|nr:flagellar hook-basal body complex protein [Lachnospiraceae bacterium]
MMRSLYSGVSGLKTHQIKMDVIGNNIANVNTLAFKSSSVTFSEIMYQTTQSASGANALTGTGGINAKQIGLGVSLGSTTTNINAAGATQTTGGALDVKIKGDSFFVVSDGSSNLFTRAGSFYFDGTGNLAMTSTGYNVMGWQVDATTGEIK